MNDGHRETRIDPARFPQAGPPAADHCSAHGRPVARRVDMALQSRVKSSTPRALRGNLFSLAGESGNWAKSVTIVNVYGWPLCASCARERALWFGLFLVLFFGAIATAVVGAVVRAALGELPGAPAFGLGVLAALLLSSAVFARASLPRLTHARASDDGTAVVVTEPAAEFARDIDHVAS